MKHLLKVLIVLSLTVMLLMNMASCRSVLDKVPFLDGPNETEETTTTAQNKETEPSETEPSETEPSETEPSETEPSETEPSETEPSETEPSETEPSETEPSETEPSETEPSETEPSETEPSETEPSETEPSETEPSETEPSETEPSETEPSETEPSETEPSETEPSETEPSETEPSETEPSETEPSETEPSETEPSETEPSETEPSETEPSETEPSETEPSETEPSETEPSETEPSETEPSETEPSATEPSETEPEDTTEPGGTTPSPDDTPTWTLVTDVSTLQAGDKVIIVAKDYDFALSITQNTNNRAQAAVIKNGNTVTFGDDVQILVLEAGKITGTYAFSTGSGYLYAASSTKNYLRTQDTLNDNGSWSIEIAADGTATIKANGTNTRNWLRYNSTNNPPLFACYASGQADVVIYKLSGSNSGTEGGETPCEHVYDNACDTTCNKCGDERTTEHADNNNDHKCDACGETLTQCADGNKDHKCDVCSKVLSECINTTLDHECDVCGKTLSECADLDSDHECDICFLSVSDCKDDNNNHICDICNAKISKCNDGDQNHFCDICGTQNSHCQDITSNHYCDWCGEKMTDCADGNKDHKCDVCSKVLSECINTTLDHDCDVCGKTLSECADLDSDHECDICFLSVSDCKDDNNNHICDICNAKISKCNDGDQNHFCDICGTQNSHCQDITDNHYCDWCGEKMTEHTYGDWIIDVPATEGVEGKKHQECSICGDKNEEIIPALDHEHNYSVTVVDPTCTTDGYTKHVCRCGDSYVTDEKAALGHTRETVPGKDATCTEDGLTDGVKCSVCGATITSQETIPATGHAAKAYTVIDGVLYYAATCGCEDQREAIEEGTTVEVANEADLKTVLTAGYSVKLTANIELTSAIEIEGKEVVINLGGYTITADWVDKNGVVEVLWAKGTGTVVTINGEGSMKSGTGSGTNSVVSSTDGAIVNINGGYYYSAAYGAVIATTRNGVVNIYGGKFEAAEQYDGKWYVLDIDERVDPEYFGEINVYGGEFVSYDPVNNTNDNAALANKVANGYHSIKNDNSYFVSKHVYESNVTNPTCENGGYTTYTCACGNTYVDSYTSASGHSFTNYVSNEDATCTEDGTKTAKCDRCEETDTIADEGSALNHSFTNYVSNEDATCTEDGTKTAKCDRCEETETIADEGSALDHSFTNYVSNNDATCTEDGTKTAKCDRCEETETVTDEDSKIGHVWDADAECTRDGCHANLVIKEVIFTLGANGTASHYDGTEKASYTETVGDYILSVTGGSKFYTSARDLKGNSCFKLGTGSATGGFSFTVPNDVTQVVIYAAKYKASTSKIKVNGTTHTLTKNSDNGEYDAIIVDTSITKKVTLETISGGVRAMINSIIFYSIDEYDCDHQYEETRKGATCTVDGSITNTCTKCSKTKVEVIKASGHKYGEGVVTAPTCTDKGFVTSTCSVCGDIKTVDGEDSLGHVMSDWIETKAPSCTEKGEQTRECTREGCNHSETQDVDMIDHVYVNGTCSCGATEGSAPTVTLDVPNGIDSVVMGEGNVLPSADAPDGYTFAGWSEVELDDETTTKPTILEAGSVYGGDATVLYAVYTRTETTPGTQQFVKVTSAPSDWSGQYLIVYETGKVAFNGALTTLDAASNTVSVTISNGTIQATDALIKSMFTISKSGSNYTIKSASGYYIGNTADSNKLNSSTSTKYTNTISLNNDGSVQIVGSGGSILRYNATSGQYRFRYFKSGTYTSQKAIHLYKLVTSAGTTTTYYDTL